MQYLMQTYKYIYFLNLTIFVPGLKVGTSINRDYEGKVIVLVTNPELCHKQEETSSWPLLDIHV